MTSEEVQISCKFVTRLPEQYRIAPTPIAVPGKLTRYGLSEVINHLLNLDPPKPFDFLVQGELVRTSLEKLVVRKAISAESALEVEYIPAVAPPSEEATGKHEDWVSAVDGSWAAAVATGCYDGTARLWTPGGAQLIRLSPPDVAVPEGASTAAVTTVCLLPPAPDSHPDGSTGCVVVAGGHDGVIRAWGVEVDAKRGGASAVANETCNLFVGHVGAVKCVASAPGGERVASCGHDHTVRVWHRDAGFAFDKNVRAGRKTKKSSKRRKGDDGDDAEPAPRFLVPGVDEPPPTPEHLAPLGKELVLNGHTDSVSAVAWESVDVVWSGGFDHALKSWDVETGKNTQSYDVPKAIMGMACVAGGGRVAWCGGGDKAVHMWDPRVGATTGATTSLMSHTVRIDRSARFALFEFGFFFSSRLFRSFSRHVSARRRASVMRPHSFPESATTWGTKQSL